MLKGLLFNNRNRRAIERAGIKIDIDEERRFRIYHNGSELSKLQGMRVCLFSEGRWHYFPAKDSILKISRPDETSFSLRLYNRTLPVVLHWGMELGEGSRLKWSVELELKGPIRLDAVKAVVLLSRSYKSWFSYSGAKEGLFADSAGEFRQEIGIADSDFLSIGADRPEIATLLLRAVDSPLNVSLCNTDDLSSSREVDLCCNGQKEFYAPGRHSCFQAVIELCGDKSAVENIIQDVKGRKRREEEEALRKKEEERLAEEEQRRLEEERLRQEEQRRLEEERRKQEELKRLEEERLRIERARDRQRRTLEAGDFRIYFDYNNRFHFYHRNEEFTKAHGLHTGIFSEGRWYGSADSEAAIENSEPGRLRINFRHRHLPVIQSWDLRLDSAGVIRWSVDMRLEQPLRIERRNACLFLSRAYDRWLAPPDAGAFPAAFGLQWQMASPSESRPGFIGLTSGMKQLPGITLKGSEDGGRLAVHNADMDVSSRVLEERFEERVEFYKAGDYSFSRAVIRLYNDNAAIEGAFKEAEEKENALRELRKERLRRAAGLRQGRKEFEGLRLRPAASRVVIYGDSQGLHDKISGEAGGFNRAVACIKAESGTAAVGISRFNFFKIHEVVQFISTLRNARIDTRPVCLPLFPASGIYSSFLNYIKEIKSLVAGKGIELFLKDVDLLKLLQAVSSQSNRDNERDLLRLLGLIAEHPFIGPQTLVLDTTHKCNTNCAHCWIHNPRSKTPPAVLESKMDDRLYRKIIDDAAAILSDEVIIQGDGEPLLDDRFIEMARYARDKGLKVLFFTNGILLDEATAKCLIDLEVNEIFCSLPAGTDLTYSWINSRQSKDTFHRIVGNLKNLISLRNGSGRPLPLLQMTHVIHNMNCHEIEQMSAVDADIGADRARFYLARLDENIAHLKILSSQVEALKASLRKAAALLKESKIDLQDNIFFQLDNYQPETGYWSQGRFLETGCPVGWFFALILAGGELSMCCHMRVVGRLGERSLREAWNSREYNDYRVKAKHMRDNMDARFSNGVKLYDDFCNHCDTHQVILRINGLLERYGLKKFL
ncbi:MAG: radical SAM protein [Candidatus Omnitrophica bacterium]|nr:radical SAM protein [Candidatus Omnitrophota bacterium]